MQQRKSEERGISRNMHNLSPYQQPKASSSGSIRSKAKLLKGKTDKQKNDSTNEIFPNFALKNVFYGHSSDIAALKFSTRGKWLASCSADKTIRILNTETNKFHITLTGHTLGISDIAWTTDDNYLASASDDKTLKLWDIHTSKCLRTFIGHSNYVFCCNFNPLCSLLASGSFDHTIKIWEVSTAKLLKTLRGHSDPVTSVCYNRDGQLLLSSSLDGICRLWEMASGICLKAIYDDKNPPIAYATFSPNGKFILSVRLDSTIKLLDYMNNKVVKTYAGHLNLNTCLNACFCVNGKNKLIVTGSEDSSIYIYNLQTKAVVQILRGHKRDVLAVACHPYKLLIASAGFGKQSAVYIWES